MTHPSFARSNQCAACPWKRVANPKPIPGGYDPAKHAALVECNGDTGKLMACHESAAEKPYACVGWVLHELGPGNNIGIRLRAMRGDIDGMALTVDGPQHESREAMCAQARKRRTR